MMNREIADHEIHADEIEDVRAFLDSIERIEPTDAELEKMEAKWLAEGGNHP